MKYLGLGLAVVLTVVSVWAKKPVKEVGIAADVTSPVQLEDIFNAVHELFMPPLPGDAVYIHPETSVYFVDWNSGEWPKELVSQAVAKLQTLGSLMYPEYTFYVVLDYHGDLVIYNQEGAAVFRRTVEYDPYFWALNHFGLSDASELTLAQQELYHAAKFGVEIRIVPVSFAESYLEEEVVVAEQEALELSTPMAMAMMSEETVTNLMMKIGIESNALEVGVFFPTGYTNPITVFQCSSLVDWDWSIFSNFDPAGISEVIWNPDPVGFDTRFWVAAERADADQDGLENGVEKYVYSTDPGNADSDGDDMTDWEEVFFGFDPLVDDRYEDMDGDRYPNIYELRHGSDPTDASNIPAASEVITVGVGQAYTNIQDAFEAALYLPEYPIVRVLPGEYSPVFLTNYRSDGQLFWRKKTLLISASGPTATRIDANGASTTCLYFQNETIVDGFTLENSTGGSGATAIRITGGIDGQINNCIIRNNTNETYVAPIVLADCNAVFRNCLIYNNKGKESGAVYIWDDVSVSFKNCTFYNNTGDAQSFSFYDQTHQTHLINSIIWGSDTGISPEFVGSNLVDHLTIQHSIVKQFPAGFNIDSGNTTNNPHLNDDGYLTFDSTDAIDSAVELGLIYDVQLEPRPYGSAPDIGADEYNEDLYLDTDGDGMTDVWESAYGLNPYSSMGVDGANGDFDGDGYRNIEEFVYQALPNDSSSIIQPMTYEYDALNRLKRSIYPNNEALGFGYDEDGNIDHAVQAVF